MSSEIDIEQVKLRLKRYKVSEVTSETMVSKHVIYNFLRGRNNMTLTSFVKVLNFLNKFDKVEPTK